MNDLEQIGRAVADVFVWVVAVAITLVAAFTQPLLTAPWFVVGYAAFRLLPRPARPGVRVQLWMGMIMGAILGAALMHSWGPIV